jgi:hypothetical protein
VFSSAYPGKFRDSTFKQTTNNFTFFSVSFDAASDHLKDLDEDEGIIFILVEWVAKELIGLNWLMIPV